MKLIDEKGKLFGKVSIIDLFVLVVILLVIGVAAYKYGGPGVKQMIGEEVITKDVTFTVKCTVDNEAIASSVHEGDNLIIGSDYTEAFINSVKYTPAKVYNTNNEGLPVYSDDPIKKDVFIIVKMKTESNTPIVKLGGKEILKGMNFQVKTEIAYLPGMITTLEIK